MILLWNHNQYIMIYPHAMDSIFMFMAMHRIKIIKSENKISIMLNKKF